jgi:hypothetical protein
MVGEDEDEVRLHQPPGLNPEARITGPHFS